MIAAFTRGRIIDLTPAAAQQLGFSGLARVDMLCAGSAAGPSYAIIIGLDPMTSLNRT
jgi:rare lipoprotein A (peptidoglycan hydrolase)